MREFFKAKANELSAGTVRLLYRRVIVCGALVCCIFAASASRADDSSPRETARAQFEKAETQRAAMEAKPEIARSLKDYTAVVNAYRRVYLTTPFAADDPAALNEVAALYRTMGDLFDEKYYQSAVDTYQFLLRDYPDSRYREDALLAVGHIEQTNLHAPDLARKSYQEFLSLHPHSAHAGEVRASLASLNTSAQPAKSSSTAATAANSSLPAKAAEPTVASSAQAVKDAAGADNFADLSSGQSSASSDAAGKAHAQVSSIRTWNADSYTRVVIDVGAQVKYQAVRLGKPDRIFFDIDNSSATSALLHKSVEVQNGGFVKSIRVAQNQADMIRVVLDVSHANDYSVFLLPNPYRLIVDVYGTSSDPAQDAANKKDTPASTAPVVAADSANLKAPEPAAKKENPAYIGDEVAAAPSALPSKSAARSPFEEPAIVQHETQTQRQTAASARKQNQPDQAQSVQDAEASAPTAPRKSAKIAATRTREDTADAQPALAPEPTASKKSAKEVAVSTREEAVNLQPPSVPQPTRTGQESLSRALGLKVSRIVIDPGHGGHDTGTIGPTGLMEKDLCLDVAVRVGKLIAQRLPGAEVVFTRDDDTFIPLEQRTEIANDAQADLFLSIHANSSPSHSTRGIETYYLNLNASSNAMAVAARENALSDKSVHDLDDLVKRIAKNEKIEESRDFASDIQDSLSKHIDNPHGEPNRGVRDAPFVVLIGADMPSVLAEISFLSNPTDEQWLKQPENRQRVAEGLYQGIESYLHSINSLATDKDTAARRPAANRSGIVASSREPAVN